MFVVIILGAIPLILMHTIVSNTVRENTHSNTTLLTQGILNQSQNYLNVILKELNKFSVDLARNNDFLDLLEKEHVSKRTIEYLRSLRRSAFRKSEMAILDLDSNSKSVLFSSNYIDGKIINSYKLESFCNSQQVILLKENYSRVLWLGSAPIGIEDLHPSIWCYRIIHTDSGSFILAVSVDTDLLSDLLNSIENSTLSNVRLITTDNIIYPRDNAFFSYSFAAKSLSRSDKGRFISFKDKRIKNGKEEKLLIHIYSDPIYFYNLVVLTPERSLLRGFESVYRTTSITLALLTLFSVSFGVIGIIFLQKRINQIICAVRDVSVGQYNVSLPKSKVLIEEDVKLTRAISYMAIEVSNSRLKLKTINEELEKRVEERTRELEKTYNELSLTRDSLIHSEKMATLGRNAAKITHEINNSLSISITASSHLSVTISELIDKINSNSLTKSDFLGFASIVKEVSEMIQNNLKKASELSTSFKEFASDQSIDELKTINLFSYISEIIKGYSYKLKKLSHVIELKCSEAIELSTYPTIIYQTVTNLINNSILHGFENMTNGLIEIIITEDNGTVNIHYRDNGAGITKENLSNLYKPFFTTKPKEGGTGLGLNIIRDLILNKLNGSIECTSTYGVGTIFTINIPKGELS